MNPFVLASMDKANRINWPASESTGSAWHHPRGFTSNSSYLGVNMGGDNEDDANQQRFYYQNGAGWSCNEIQHAAEECKPSLLYGDNQALRHLGFLQSSQLNPPLYYTGMQLNPTTPTTTAIPTTASIFRNNGVPHDGIVVDTSVFPISATATANNIAGNIALSQFQSSPTDICMQFGELVGSAMQQQQRYVDMSSRLGLNLGSQTYFSGSDHTTAAALLQHFSRRPARFSSSSAAQIPSCQAQGCKADLSLAKHYHRRHKVCEFHSKSATAVISGSTQRFCQQCSRFHGLSEFDEGKRSCRKRLADHNRRRRKPQPASNIVADSSKTNSTTTSPTAPASNGNNGNGSQALELTKLPPNRIQIKSEVEDGDDELLKYEAESQSSPCPSLSLSTIGATDSTNKSTNNKSLQSQGSYYRGIELPKFPWLQPKQQEGARIKEKSSSPFNHNNNMGLSSSSPSHNMSLSPSQQDNERLVPIHLNSNSNQLNSSSLQNFFPHINRNINHHQLHADNSIQRADRQEVLSLLNHADGENRGGGAANPYQHTTSQLADSHFFQINQFHHSRNSTQEASDYNNGD